MDYKPDMPAAARRHIEAADALVDGFRPDVAGYLYGIAAECAIKSMIWTPGCGHCLRIEGGMIPFTHTFRTCGHCCATSSWDEEARYCSVTSKMTAFYNTGTQA